MACCRIRAAPGGIAAGSGCGASGASTARRAAVHQPRPLQVPPFGLDGGEPAGLSALYLMRDGERQALPSKVMNLMVRKGDIIRLETSGGGGFGAAKMRARELVERRRAARLRQCRGCRFNLRPLEQGRFGRNRFASINSWRPKRESCST